MTPPAALVSRGVRMLPCMGDGRQSGTSDSPSILNASPESAAGGNLAILETGDKVKVDLNTRRVDLLLSEEEIERRRAAYQAPRIEARFAVAGVVSPQRRAVGDRRVSGFRGRLSRLAEDGPAAFALVDCLNDFVTGLYLGRINVQVGRGIW